MNVFISQTWLICHYRLEIKSWGVNSRNICSYFIYWIMLSCLRKYLMDDNPKSKTGSKENKSYIRGTIKWQLKKGFWISVYVSKSWELINIKSRACIQNMWTSLIESYHHRFVLLMHSFNIVVWWERRKKTRKWLCMNHLLSNPITFSIRIFDLQATCAPLYASGFRSLIACCPIYQFQFHLSWTASWTEKMTSQEKYATTKVEIMIHQENEFH